MVSVLLIRNGPSLSAYATKILLLWQYWKKLHGICRYAITVFIRGANIGPWASFLSQVNRPFSCYRIDATYKYGLCRFVNDAPESSIRCNSVMKIKRSISSKLYKALLLCNQRHQNR